MPQPDPLPDLLWAKRALEQMSKEVNAHNLSEITGGQANEYVCQRWLHQQAVTRISLVARLWRLFNRLKTLIFLKS